MIVARVVCVVLTFALVGCGGPTPGRQPSVTPALREAQGSLKDTLIARGATPDEASCVERVLRDDPAAYLYATAAEVRDAVIDAVRRSAPPCARRDRISFLAVLAGEFMENDFVTNVEPLLADFEFRLMESGAEDSEAACITRGIIEMSGPVLFGGPERDALVHADAERLISRTGCVSKERARAIGQRLTRNPALRMLRQAGADKSTALCLIRKVGVIDLFLPSDDFTGADARRIATEEFLAHSPACASAPEIRRIVEKLPY